MCKGILLIPLKILRKCASLINETSGIRWPEVIMALATVALAVVTWRYVILTKNILNDQIKQTNQQQEQFELANRPKVWFYNLSGDIKKGNLLFINAGNLPAENCKFLWGIVKVEGEQILQELTEQSNVIQHTSLDQDEILSLPYSSNFNLDEQVIFLVVSWKYMGKGIEGYRLRNEVLLWDIYQKPNAAWVKPSSSMGSNQVAALNKVKEQQRAILIKE